MDNMWKSYLWYKWIKRNFIHDKIYSLAIVTKIWKLEICVSEYEHKKIDICHCELLFHVKLITIYVIQIKIT